jgi:hypothetical protein
VLINHRSRKTCEEFSNSPVLRPEQTIEMSVYLHFPSLYPSYPLDIRLGGIQTRFRRCGEEKSNFLLPEMGTRPPASSLQPPAYSQSLYEQRYLSALCLYGSGYGTGMDFRERSNGFMDLMEGGNLWTSWAVTCISLSRWVNAIAKDSFESINIS